MTGDARTQPDSVTVTIIARGDNENTPAEAVHHALEYARKAGFIEAWSDPLVPPPSEAGRDLIEGGITAFIASIPTDAEMRAATIEECAKVADDLALWFGARQVFLAEDAVDDCARKIRALSPDPGAVAVASEQKP